VSEHDFDSAIAAYRDALQAFVRGDPKGVLSQFSEEDDVTLANPLGPPRRGPSEGKQAAEEAAAHFQGGSVRFEEVSRYATSGLGYVVQFERVDAQLVGSEGTRQMSLRVTMVFRREDGAWKVAHRHADPITSARPISSTFDN